MKNMKLLIPVFVALGTTALTGAEVSAPVDVAPQAPATRSQRLPAVAWSDDAKCWLVAWREGFLNEPEKGCEIWCARISAEGKALDPSGIKVADGAGLKDNPKVASDGRDFLVVWEELSTGKDSSTGSGQGWDVRGARIAGDRKAQDEKGLVIAGGEHNQCCPAVVFSAGHYLVFSQEMTGSGTPGDSGTGYALYCTTVTKQGKVDGGKHEPITDIKAMQCCWPVAGANGDGVFLGYTIYGYSKWGLGFCGGQFFDGGTAKSRAMVQPLPGKDHRGHPLASEFETQRFPAVALGGDGAMMATLNIHPGGLKVLSLTRDGQIKERMVANAVCVRGFPLRYSMAWESGRYMLASDHCLMQGKWPVMTVRSEIRGWSFGADGKPVDDLKTGFVISSDPGKDQTEPAIAAGPKGVCLVAYVETRGVDDVKVMARIVK